MHYLDENQEPPLRSPQVPEEEILLAEDIRRGDLPIPALEEQILIDLSMV